ncbi:MAG TPA: acyl-CoA dehydrogenase family protein [Acidimicrobiales bacterium]|nr:acyl-CoA dehydrogenase family protein [Acidimicrobiales bacterium]
MRFAFTDDQVALRDAVRLLLARECPAEVVRAAWPEGTDTSGARKGEGARAAADRSWAALTEMGVLGVAVSEARGGLGLGPVDWVLLAEEAGYAALPHPFAETVAVVAPLLDRVGDPDGVLPGLLDGSRPGGAVPPGSATVAWADEIGYLVRLDHRPGQPEPWRAQRVTAGVAAGAVEVGERAPADAVDAGRRLARLDGGVAGGPLGGPEEAEAAFDGGALAVAAQLVGLGRRMVDLTVAYATERRQFGAPIGSFQAVKHHLADAALGLRFAAPAVYGAAWSLATGQPTAGRDVSMAKALASDAARAAGRHALQCHGAIGYTVEADLHLYLKRAEALARSWGDAAWHRRRVATALGL